MYRKLCALVLTAITALGLIAGAGVADAAGPGASTTFNDPSYWGAAGSFTWWNRVVEVAGSVYTGDPAMSTDPDPEAMTQVVFDAFQGTTRVASQARAADYNTSPRSFHFTIGDSALPGGIDRMRITTCIYLLSGKLRGPCQVFGQFSRPF